jgi:hypothetical protein
MGMMQRILWNNRREFLEGILVTALLRREPGVELPGGRAAVLDTYTGTSFPP